MRAYPHLTHLLGSYFHQDFLEVTGDEVATVHAFCVENPGRAQPLANDIAALLSLGQPESELAEFADRAACNIDPRYDGGTYRQWFTEIEAQARAYAAEHPQP